MSRGGNKPETISRKQVERAELSRDACAMKCGGVPFREIAKKLGISLGLAFKLVHEGIDAYNREAVNDAGKMVEATIARLLIASQELWNQWEKSKRSKHRITTKTRPDGVEITKMREGRLGDPRYLAEFRANMEMIARLRGVFNDDDDDEDIFEEYAQEMEDSYEPPPPELIEDDQEPHNTNEQDSPHA